MSNTIIRSLFASFMALLCAAKISAAETLNIGTPTNGATIRVKAGTYAPIDLRNYEGTAFTLQAVGEVIIDANGEGRCATLPAGITLDGFTLRNGVAEQGGGVFGGRLLNCVVENCAAVLGGGAYDTVSVATKFTGNSAQFFGSAIYGGSAMSCLIEGNGATGDGAMGTVVNATIANATLVNNAADYDVAGTMFSNVSNSLYYNNTLNRGIRTEGAYTKVNAVVPTAHFSGDLHTSEVLTADQAAETFKDVNSNDWDILASSATVNAGDNALAGNYGTLWYAKDFAGRGRLTGAKVDLGAYELPNGESYTVTATVTGAGSCTVVPATISEGERVTYTASKNADFSREFLGFYLNGELLTNESTLSYRPSYSEKDSIEARFAGLTATSATLTTTLGQLSSTQVEQITLAAGTYTLPTLSKKIIFVSEITTDPSAVQMTLTGDLQGSIFVGMTVSGTFSNGTLHRVIAQNATGTAITATSTWLKSGSLRGAKAVNLTTSAGVTTQFDQNVDAFALANGATTPTLPKGNDAIDAAIGGGVAAFDALDLYGRPRKLGNAVDKGAVECEWLTLTVAIEGAYTTISPAVGTHDMLYGDVVNFNVAGPRDFLGWTLSDRAEVVLDKSTQLTLSQSITASARFAGLDVSSNATLKSALASAQKGDVISIAPGTYTEAILIPAGVILRGTGTQAEVHLQGAISGAGELQCVTIDNVTIQNVTLNRVLVNNGSIANAKVYNSVLLNVTSATGTFVNNTVFGTTLPSTAIATRTLTSNVTDYSLTESNTEAIDKLTTIPDGIGALDYYGNPRVSGFGIDLGAAEWQAPDYTVTVKVIGHGNVAPRGTFSLPRGADFKLTATEDTAFPRLLLYMADDLGNMYSTGATVKPLRDNMVITIFFAPRMVTGGGDTLQQAILNGPKDDYIGVGPGTYSAINTRGYPLFIKASNGDPSKTIIDGANVSRAATLSEDGTHETVLEGFTLQNGLSTEGAGALGGTIVRCIVRDNKLTYNGLGAGLRSAKAINCLIIDNGNTDIARSAGGGAAESELINCTVVRNTAEKGAGLYECTAINTITSLNPDYTGAVSDWYGETVADPENCCGSLNSDGSYYSDPEKIFGNPRVRGTDWVMTDWTLRADATDCCVNTATAEPLSGYAIDLVGNERVYGDAPDMGALEWSNPDYQVTITVQGRGSAIFNGETISYTQCPVVKTVPRGTSVTLGATSEASAPRIFDAVYADGVRIDAERWTVTAKNTLQASLVFTFSAIEATTAGELTTACNSAIAGETINLAAGTYTNTIKLPAGVTLNCADGVMLTGGTSLGEGAIVRNATITTKGANGGIYERCKFVEITETAVTNATIKNSLVINNTAALKNSVAYLSTIANNGGVAVDASSTIYGSVAWGNTRDSEDGATIVDSFVGGTPGFVLPAPDGDDYMLARRSALVDAAGKAMWPGFSDEDRAMLDIAGNVRPSANTFDIGAYEYQGAAEEQTSTWTWYGSITSSDGDVSGATWVRSIYGAPKKVGVGDAVTFADFDVFNTANVTVTGETTVGAMTLSNSKTSYTFTGDGNFVGTGDLSKSSNGELNFGARMGVNGAATFSNGTVNVLDNANVTIGKTLNIRNNTILNVMAGTIRSGSLSFSDSARIYQTGGELDFGSNLALTSKAQLHLSGGTFSGGKLSVALTNNENSLAAPVYFDGATVNLTRIETGDASGRGYGDIYQTDGSVTLTGSSTGKSSPLHISHWSGAAKYILKGGELNVPNAPVQLGLDAKGTLDIQGGVANLYSYAIQNGQVIISDGYLNLSNGPSGKLTAAGGTVTARKGMNLSAETQAGTTTAFCAEEGILKLTLTGSGTANLAQGSYSFAGNTVGCNLTLGAGISLEGVLPSGLEGRTLTLPGVGVAPRVTPPSSDSTEQSVLTNVNIAFSSLPGKNVRTLALEGVFTGTPNALAGYTFDVVTEATESVAAGLYVTRTADITPPAEGQTADYDLTLTFGGTSASRLWNIEPTNKVWTNADGATVAYEAGKTAKIVVGESSPSECTLIVNSAIDLSKTKFEIAAGKTLSLSMTAGLTIGELVLENQGVLALTAASPSASLTYSSIVSSGEIQVRSSNIALKGALAETAVTVANGGTLTLLQASPKSVTLETGSTLTLGSNAFADGGEIISNGNATINLNADIIANSLKINVASGTLEFGNSTSYLMAGELAILQGASVTYPLMGSLTVNKWSVPAAQGSTVILPTSVAVTGELNVIGEGTACFATAKTFSTAITLNGNVCFNNVATFNKPVSVKGSLNLKDGATFGTDATLVIFENTKIALPYGETLLVLKNLRVGEGVSFVLDATNVTAETFANPYALLSSNQLDIASLAGIAVSLENVSDGLSTIVNRSLEAKSLLVSVTTSEKITWKNVANGNWSTAANWSGTYADSKPVVFPAVAGQTVSVTQTISPSAVTFLANGSTTISGAGKMNGRVAVVQNAGSTATWNNGLVPLQGTYALDANATMNIALPTPQTYTARLSGEGTVRLTSGSMTIGCDQPLFTGLFDIASNANVTANTTASLATASIKLASGASLTSTIALPVRELTIGQNAKLCLTPDEPLSVTQAVTLPSSGTATIQISSLESKVATYELLRLPQSAAGVAAKFTLQTPALTNAVAVLAEEGNTLLLKVYADTDLAWAGKNGTSDLWTINGATEPANYAAGKTLWFNDVSGTTTAAITLPSAPAKINVTSTTTTYTLSGQLGSSLVVSNGATVTVYGTVNFTSLANAGTIIVKDSTLDLTKCTVTGNGKFVIGSNGMIRANAAIYAVASYSVQTQGNGVLCLDAEAGESIVMPSNRIDPQTNVMKGGAGELTISSATFTAMPTEIAEGTLIMPSIAGMHARYVKFEAFGRYAGSANGTKTGLADFSPMLNGRLTSWPESAKVVRLDSGVSNSIQVGLTNDDQNKDINLSGLIDGDPSTEVIWGEWHNTYNNGKPRLYFVVDIGEAAEDFMFDGYSIATPSIVSGSFWKWSVAVSNDISTWRPDTGATNSNADANVWYTVDQRERTNSTTGLQPNTWLNSAGYLCKDATGTLTSIQSVKVNAGAIFDLTKVSMTNTGLENRFEIGTLSGAGTVRLPIGQNIVITSASDVRFEFNTDEVTTEGFVLKGSFNNVTIPFSTAFVESVRSQMSKNGVLLFSDFDGALASIQGFDPSLYTLVSSAVDGKTQVRVFSAAKDLDQTSLTATLSGTACWKDLVWKNGANQIVTLPSWDAVTSAILNLEGDTTLSIDNAYAFTGTLTVQGNGELTLRATADSSSAMVPVSTFDIGSHHVTLYDEVVPLCVYLKLVSTADGVLTIGSDTTSSAVGSDTAYAHPNFYGTVVVPEGQSLTIAGGGGKMGRMPGSILVTGGKVILTAGEAFGWAYKNPSNNLMNDDVVLTLDGGTLVSTSANQYLRRTIEMKNGASMKLGRNFRFARGSMVKVTEGDATLTGEATLACDSAWNNTGARSYAAMSVAPEARLSVACEISTGSNAPVLQYEGGGYVSIDAIQWYTDKTSIKNVTITRGVNTPGVFFGALDFDPSSTLLVTKDYELSTSKAITGTTSVLFSESKIPELGRAVIKSLESFSGASFIPDAGFKVEVTPSEDQALYTATISADSYRALKATVTNDSNLSTLQWTTPAGNPLVSDRIVDWAEIVSIDLVLSKNATVTIDKACPVLSKVTVSGTGALTLNNAASQCTVDAIDLIVNEGATLISDFAQTIKKTGDGTLEINTTDVANTITQNAGTLNLTAETIDAVLNLNAGNAAKISAGSISSNVNTKMQSVNIALTGDMTGTLNVSGGEATVSAGTMTKVNLTSGRLTLSATTVTSASTSSGTTLVTAGNMTMTGSGFNGNLAVQSGVLTYAGTLSQTVLVSQGAQLITTTGDCRSYNATNKTYVNGTLKLNSKWTIFGGNTFVLGENALLASNAGTYYDFHQNSTVEVAGANTEITGYFGSSDTSATTTFKFTAANASMKLTGYKVSNQSVKATCAEGASGELILANNYTGGTLTIDANVALSGEKGWAGSVTLLDGSAVKVDTLTPLTLGALTLPTSSKINFVINEALLDDSDPFTVVPLLKSTTALTEGMIDAPEGWVAQVSNVSNVYTLMLVPELRTKIVPVYATVTGPSNFTALTWYNALTNVQITDEIPWQYIQSVTLNGTGTVKMDVELANLDTLTIADSSAITINQSTLDLTNSTLAGTGTLKVGTGSTVVMNATDALASTVALSTVDSGVLALSVPAEVTIALPDNLSTSNIQKRGEGVLSLSTATSIDIREGAGQINGAYRYFRWHITSTRSANAGMQISEFALYGTDGNRISLTAANVLRTGNFTANIADDQFTKNEKVGNIFDNTTGSKWFYGSGNPGYMADGAINLVIDLGATPAVVAGFNFATANDSNSRDPKDWSLDASYDGVAWTTLLTNTEAPTTNRQTYVDKKSVAIESSNIETLTLAQDTTLEIWSSATISTLDLGEMSVLRYQKAESLTVTGQLTSTGRAVVDTTAYGEITERVAILTAPQAALSLDKFAARGAYTLEIEGDTLYVKPASMAITGSESMDSNTLDFIRQCYNAAVLTQTDLPSTIRVQAINASTTLRDAAATEVAYLLNITPVFTIDGDDTLATIEYTFDITSLTFGDRLSIVSEVNVTTGTKGAQMNGTLNVYGKAALANEWAKVSGTTSAKPSYTTTVELTSAQERFFKMVIE